MEVLSWDLGFDIVDDGEGGHVIRYQMWRGGDFGGTFKRPLSIYAGIYILILEAGLYGNEAICLIPSSCAQFLYLDLDL